MYPGELLIELLAGLRKLALLCSVFLLNLLQLSFQLLLLAHNTILLYNLPQ